MDQKRRLSRTSKRSGRVLCGLALAHRYLTLTKERYGADQPPAVPALLKLAFLYETQGRIDEIVLVAP